MKCRKLICNEELIAPFLIGKFSSKKIESQYNLTKIVVSDPENSEMQYKKCTAYMQLELKKKLKKENITLQMKHLLLKFPYKKHSRKLQLIR